MIEGAEHAAWSYRSPSYHALNLTFGVRSTELDVGMYLDRVLAGLRCDAEEPAIWYSIAYSAAGPEEIHSLFFGSELVVHAHSKAFAIETLLWHLNGATVDRADPFVVLHAGGVALDGAGAVISGPSGAGKTTLTAALVRAGFGYLTDEALAIDPMTGLLQPYPKALAIKRGSFELLAGLGGPPPEASARVWHVVPTDIRPDAIAGPTRPSLILLPTQMGPGEPGGVVGMQKVGRAETLVELFRQSFGSVDPASTMRVLAGIVAGSACFRVSTVDLSRAVRSVTEAIRSCYSDRR